MMVRKTSSLKLEEHEIEILLSKLYKALELLRNAIGHSVLHLYVYEILYPEWVCIHIYIIEVEAYGELKRNLGNE